MTNSHWLIGLSFCLAHTVLPGSGDDALGVVSRKDARAEGDSSSSPVSGLLLLLLPLRGVNHVVVFIFFVMGMVRL